MDLSGNNVAVLLKHRIGLRPLEHFAQNEGKEPLP